MGLQPSDDILRFILLVVTVTYFNSGTHLAKPDSGEVIMKHC